MIVFSLASVLAAQQLIVTPFPAVVGEPVRIRATRAEQAIVDLEVCVERDGDAATSVGRTDSEGSVVFRPSAEGYLVFSARIDGVRNVAPLSVVAARPRWPLATAGVSLGLALLYWNVRRARGRRGP